jgi:hypothetical protein
MLSLALAGRVVNAGEVGDKYGLGYWLPVLAAAAAKQASPVTNPGTD